MSQRQFTFLLQALHNKQIKLKNDENLIANVFKNNEINTKSSIATKEEFNNQITNKNDNNVKELDQKIEQSDNELEFTSDFSLFSYDSASDDNDDFENEQTPTPECQVKLEKLDLSKLKYNPENKSYTISSDSKKCNNTITTNTNNNKQEYLSLKNTKPTKTRSFSNLRRSPSRDSISKLNLFRKIFKTEEDQREFNSMSYSEYIEEKSGQSNRIGAQSETARSNINNNYKNRFFKVNDLVSIMIDEDYFNRKYHNRIVFKKVKKRNPDLNNNDNNFMLNQNKMTNIDDENCKYAKNNYNNNNKNVFDSPRKILNVNDTQSEYRNSLLTSTPVKKRPKVLPYE